MNSIELMVEEHKNIKRILRIVRIYCNKILNGELVQYEVFYKLIDLIKNYADKHHHGKEETMLFNRMVEKLGPIADKLVTHGMYVEHDQGRLFIQELEVAVKHVLEGDEEARLDIIANAISYTHLLYRHIDKEDQVVYIFAKNKLDQATLDIIDKECEAFERAASVENVQNRYLAMIDEFEDLLQI